MVKKLLTDSISACNVRSMPTKRRIKMSKNNGTCSKYCKEQHATEERMYCGNFASYAFEAYFFLFLFFMLPHAVNGIANEVEKPKQNVDSVKISTISTISTISSSTAMTATSRAEAVYNEPHFMANRTVIVELFEWKFVDVNVECTNFLGPKGYAGVQLSPVTEHLLGGVEAQSWLARYQPVSYKFATRSGSVEDFLAMSRACNAAGVRVYVDVVLNHMAGSVSIATTDDDDTPLMDLVGTAGSTVNLSTLDYNGVPFDALDFHKPCALQNYFNSSEVRNCQLNGQPDLDHSRPTVHERIVEFLNQLIEMGVAGFRIDAAKYMWPNELKAIYEAVNDLNSAEFGFKENSRPLFYQEIVDMGVDAISKMEYSSLGIVTEYLYAAELSTIFRGKVPLSSLINWGPAMGFLPHPDALVFVDTHESQHGYLERELGKNELLSYKQQRRYIMSTAFMFAHPYGRIKRILSSYNFRADEKQRGPPIADSDTNSDADGDGDENGNGHREQLPSILSPEIDSVTGQCTPASGWICEHRWPPIVNMLAMANDLSATDDGVIDFQTYGPNHIAFCRGQKAFIAINNDENLDYATTVRTCLEPGVYCDLISGGKNSDNTDCQGKRIVVKENGMVDLMLPAMAMMMATGAVENAIPIDMDNVDGADDNEDAEWKGSMADVDYGVIAIYIDSKLVNNEARVGNFEMVEGTKTTQEIEIDMKSEAAEMEYDRNDGISVDKATVTIEGTDATPVLDQSVKPTDEGVDEKVNIENALEVKSDGEVKSNQTECIVSNKPSSVIQT